MSELRDKHYQVQITESNLCARKPAVTDFVLSSLEKIMLKHQQNTVISKSYKEHFWPQLVYKAGDKKMFLQKSQFVE